MKGKKVRIVAWMLAAAVLALDICGNRDISYAMRPDTALVTADDAQAESEMSGAEQSFLAMLSEYEMYGMLANGDEIPIHSEPSRDAPVVQTLPSGYQVKFLGAVLEEELWFEVSYGLNDREYTGFVRDSYVVTQDARMQEWKEEYFAAQSGARLYARGAAAVNTARGSTDLSAFPSSYRSKIQKMINDHPNWIFVPMNTGLDWSDVIANEMKDAVNLVSVDSPELWKSKAPKDYNAATGQWVIKNGTSWVQASESIVKYYIDPRNFLNEDYVFQFEQLTYNESCHTKSGVEQILSGTFMGNKKLEDGSGGGITYAEAFMKIGKELKVSPYFLASRVRQEQGVNGTSQLISGTYPGYKGYYNYFNIQATGIGEQVIRSGLEEAKAAGWTTRYAALRGGAEKTAENYIRKGQDTFYLQKFDVDASYNGLYWHQYMQNLLAAANESTNVKKSYTSMGAVNNSFVFKVPVYTNMPSQASPYPGTGLGEPFIKTAKKKAGTVTVSWRAIGEAQGYQIYRKTGKNGKYKRIKTVEGENTVSYQDKKAYPGKTYYYKVRAFQKLPSGTRYSPYSKVKSANCAVPVTSWNKFTVSGSTTVQLNWKKARVTGYKIYRKTGSGKYRCIKTVKGKSTVSYKDKSVLPGHTYTYRIRGYVVVNGKNYYSAYTSTMRADIRISQPQLRSAARSSGTGIKLAWKQEPKASGYYIYRSTVKEKGYKKIKEISGNKVLQWTDNSVVPGTAYFYKIRSYVRTSSGKGTSGSSRILAVQADGEAPVVTEVSSSAEGIRLTWAKDEKASGYQICRATDYSGSYTSLADVIDNSTVTFTDKKVALGQTYYYKVRTCRVGWEGTTYSGWSAVAGGEPELPETQLVRVSGIGTKKLTLKWQKVPEAEGYKLYRKTGKNGKYKAVKTISGASKVKVTDSGLKSKTVYYYKIRAFRKVNGKVCYSPYSGVWSVKTK